MSKHLYLIVLSLIWLNSCAGLKTVNPADRVKGETFYYDCCNPGLSAADKEMCKMAQEDDDHILWDDDGNKYEFTWSDCEIGKEPWRKYENVEVEYVKGIPMVVCPKRQWWASK